MKTIYYPISFFSLLLFFFCCQSAIAQKFSGSLRGRIVSNDGKPAESVTLQLQRLKKLTFSNSNGAFELLHLQPGADSLIISSTEFKSFKFPVLIKNDTISDIGTIYLQYNVPLLQNVEINGQSLLSYKSDYSFFVNKTQTPLIDIPQSVSTVTKEIISDKMAFNLKDIAVGVAGVNQYSGYDEYTIRGFRAENARDINGLRGYNTTYTNSMLVNIERIEIIKGPVSTLYGNCDPGGTINLVTKKPLKQYKSEINIYGGTWNHFRISGDNTGPLNKKKTLLYRINAGYDNTQSFRTGFYSKSYQVAPSLSYIPNEKFSFNLDCSISHVNTILDRGQPGVLNDANLLATPVNLIVRQPGDFMHEIDVASTLSFSYKINDHFSYNLGYLNYITQQNVADHGLKNYITNDSVDLYFTKWNYPTVTNTVSNYFTYKFKTGRLQHQMVAGYDFIQSKVNLDQNYFELPDQYGEGSGIVGTFSLKNPVYFKRPVSSYQLSDYESETTEVDGERYHTHGVYVQDQISLNRWKFLLGVRQEFYKGGGDNDIINEKVFLPRLGLVYIIGNNISAYATYNKGFDPFEATTGTQEFDAPIKPQISDLFETGIKANFFGEKLFTSFAVYQLSVQNVATNANDISNPNLFVQEGQIKSRGVELEADGNITSNLTVSFAYAYCDAKITKSKTPSQIGRYLENAPRNSGSSWIKYTLQNGKLKDFAISAGYLQASARSTLDALIKLPGYIILNSAIQYNYHHFTLAVKAENIANTTYWIASYNNVSKWPGKPRNFMVNLQYRF